MMLAGIVNGLHSKIAALPDDILRRAGGIVIVIAATGQLPYVLVNRDGEK